MYSMYDVCKYSYVKTTAWQQITTPFVELYVAELNSKAINGQTN